MIRLRQIRGADRGRQLEFEQDLIRIGRMPDSDVNFDPEVDLDASGRHAEIRNEDGRYLLIDTGSRNGTWLNGQRIKHAALRTGDQIEFGRGGPKLEIQAVDNPTANLEPIKGSTGGSRERDPRFDPLAMPVTTATRLDELTGAADRMIERRRLAGDTSKAETERRSPRSSTPIWVAAGLLLLAAAAIFIGVSLR